MRRQSKKRRKRDAEVAEFRRQFKAEVAHCEVCGHDHRKIKYGGIKWTLDIHEIAGGALREESLDRRWGILLACRLCHEEKLHDRAAYPYARQLAILKQSRPKDYNREAFVAMKYPTTPRAITEKDVEVYDDH